MRWLKVFLTWLVPVLLILVLFAYWQYQALHSRIIIPPGQEVIDVARGESFQHVLLRLEREHGFQDRLAIKVFCRLSDQCSGIQQGEYVLPEAITLYELLKKMKRGDVRHYKFTIVEGWRVSELLKAIKEVPNLEHKLLSVDEARLMQVLGLPEEHPEGLFLAETYFYKKGDSDVSILLRAYQALDELLLLEWKTRQAGLPYNTPYEALVMASIIEKETSIAAERPEIAGVFVRRLQQKWKLQTDPTVIYGLGPDWDGNLKRKHLRQRTPYNTYAVSGLPPTPIALVGKEAISAALNPADGDTMYFVARGDGSHYFSVTLEEHEEAVDKYQRYQRKQDYRSYPFH